MRISVFRKEHFNAAHRLNNPAWDDVKNKAVFGLCNNSNYHGHNYTLIVKLTGEVNIETGDLMDLKELKEIIKIYPNAYAKVKVNNIASINLFSSAGFKEEFIIFKYE